MVRFLADKWPILKFICSFVKINEKLSELSFKKLSEFEKLLKIIFNSVIKLLVFLKIFKDEFD